MANMDSTLGRDICKKDTIHCTDVSYSSFRGSHSGIN